MMASSNKQPSTSAQTEFHFEFFGIPGTLGITLILPIVILLLLHWTEVGGLDWAFLRPFGQQRFWDAFLNSPVLCPSCNNPLVLLKCVFAVVAWFLFQVILERYLPCQCVEGTLLPDHKTRLVYRINGHLAFWVTLLLLLIGWPVWHEKSQTIQFQAAPVAILVDYYAPLALVTTLLTVFLSTVLYYSSFVGNKILAKGGTSGVKFYDWFMGRELNPRLGDFDFKEFCELRPGLIGWVVLNAACMAKQYQVQGYVTGSMILVNVFQGYYVWDALYNEAAILTTMDIVTDGFGHMLCFGDLAWVPFSYSIQAKYLVYHDPHLSFATLAIIFGIHMLGFYIFRGANGQKDAFRRNPDDPKLAHLKYLQTKRGTKLLTSGWWGMARKINYLGDWLMGLSWCLVCGFDSIVPYFYAIYFCILLIHRSIRDDFMCAEKYGDDWQTYKTLVPYRFIPGVI
jgi:delta14-sterol reductase/lamin-B receptor